MCELTKVKFGSIAFQDPKNNNQRITHQKVRFRPTFYKCGVRKCPSAFLKFAYAFILPKCFIDQKANETKLKLKNKKKTRKIKPQTRTMTTPPLLPMEIKPKQNSANAFPTFANKL